MSSIGEKRIRPKHTEIKESTQANIDILKQRAIEDIDFLESMKGLNPSGEKTRCLAVAQTKIEEAIMWATKGLTYPKQETEN